MQEVSFFFHMGSLLLERERKMRKIKKLWKYIYTLSIFWDIFPPNSIIFIIKNSVFEKSRCVWSHLCNLTVLTYFIL